VLQFNRDKEKLSIVLVRFRDLLLTFRNENSNTLSAKNVLVKVINGFRAPVVF
jgi:hypothetical protein